MKHRFLIFFVLLTVLCWGSIYTSADNGISEDFFYTEVTMKPKPKDCPRPQIPEIVPIHCHYENGTLFFEFERDLGMCDVLITNLNTNSVKLYRVNSSRDAEIFIGVTESAYIEISTATGHEYEGYLE